MQYQYGQASTINYIIKQATSCTKCGYTITCRGIFSVLLAGIIKKEKKKKKRKGGREEKEGKEEERGGEGGEDWVL